MSKISEVGHAINVANFEKIISYCTAYESTYNPSNPNLQVTNLNLLLTNAQSTLTDVMAAKNNYNTAIGERKQTFAPLKPMVTRIFNAIAVTDANQEIIKDASALKRKLHGGKTATKTENSISNSRQSFDILIENLSALIDLAASVSSYTPNETELTIANLHTFVTNLQTANTNVLSKKATYSNAMIARNEILYTNNNSLVATASQVKKYVKSIFGAQSPQYKQISGIPFRNIN